MKTDSVYQRILSKIKDGTFTEGNICKLTKYYFERMTIRDFPVEERTPEVCASLMHYCNCKFSDVPETSRTREFFIDCFTDNGVFDYIRNNISSFDRQFFKDLLATNNHATYFDKNCFEIMPLEYIDEEMCSIAILTNHDWACNKWFYSVYKRKPKALTADIWKLAARFYSRMSGSQNRFLDITPEEYRDEEYFKEMCSSENKEGIMESIPQELITLDFAWGLLEINKRYVANFNEKALELDIPEEYGYGKEYNKLWKLVVRLDGYLIRDIPLNDERIEFFLSLYDKDSGEYTIGFKDKYKEYMRKKRAEKSKHTQLEGQEPIQNVAKRVIIGALAYLEEGEDPTRAIEDESRMKMPQHNSLLPIESRGIIPDEYRKTHDSEEYLEMCYKEMGIQIIGEYDRLFYKVELPTGWTISTEGYQNYVKDECGNLVIQYFYAPQFWDREAYVHFVDIIKAKRKQYVIPDVEA